jgi:hypothetical protein
LQQPDAPATKRQIDFGEGDDVVGPIRGVLDNGKNPSLPYAAAVGTIPLDLKGELSTWCNAHRITAYSCPTYCSRVCDTDASQIQTRATCPARVVQQARQLIKAKRFVSALAAAPKLTLDQAVALWLYTCESPLYGTLNRLLRARNRAELRAGFFPYLRLLLEAFAGLATPKPRMVALDLVAANPDLYVNGGELTWWGFSSTTTDIAALQVRRARGS